MNLAPQQQQQYPQQNYNQQGGQVPYNQVQPNYQQPQQQNQYNYPPAQPQPQGPQQHMPPQNFLPQGMAMPNLPNPMGGGGGNQLPNLKYYPNNLQPFQFNTGQAIREKQGIFHDDQMELFKKNAQMQSKRICGQQNIDNSQGIVIKQQVREVQSKCCCEQEMSYLVSRGDNKGRMIQEDLAPMFKIVEQSQCCQRFMCWGSCRPFELQVVNLQGDNEVFLKAVRQHTCDFLCCDRPYVDIYRFDNHKHTKIGSILHRFNCSKVVFEIYDNKGNKKWKIDDDCCQCGLQCRWMCCKSCSKAEFDIVDGQSQKYSKLHTKSHGCCKSCNGEEDTLHVSFPDKSSYDDKLLLMMGSIFLQYRYLEDNAIFLTESTKRNTY